MLTDGLCPGRRGLQPHGAPAGVARRQRCAHAPLSAIGYATWLVPAPGDVALPQYVEPLIPIGIEQAACARLSERITTLSQQSPIQNLQSKMVLRREGSQSEDRPRLHKKKVPLPHCERGTRGNPHPIPGSRAGAARRRARAGGAALPPRSGVRAHGSSPAPARPLRGCGAARPPIHSEDR